MDIEHVAGWSHNGRAQGDVDTIRTGMRRLMWDFSKPTISRKTPGGNEGGIFVAETDDKKRRMKSWISWHGFLTRSFQRARLLVYVAFQEAKAKMQANKLSRGFYPSKGGKAGKHGNKVTGVLSS